MIHFRSHLREKHRGYTNGKPIELSMLYYLKEIRYIS